MRFFSINVAIMLSIVFATISCTQKKENKGESEKMGEGEEVPVATDFVTGYMDLKDALVATDYEKAKSSAGVFRDLVKGNVDASFESAMIAVANSLIESQDVEGQREHFEQASTLMYALASNGQLEGQTLYKQFCPMAFNNKGAYWLSLDEGILNPYFGHKMLKCGYVEEIL